MNSTDSRDISKEAVSDYVESMGLTQPLLIAEMEKQIESYCDDNLSADADGDFVARTITSAFGEPKNVGNVAQKELVRASHTTEVIIIAIGLAAVLLLAIPLKVYSLFSIVLFLKIAGASLAVGLIYSIFYKFRIEKMMRGVQSVSILAVLYSFINPILEVYFLAYTDFSKITYSAPIIVVSLLYAFAISFLAAMVRYAVAYKPKYRLAVAATLSAVGSNRMH